MLSYRQQLEGRGKFCLILPMLLLNIVDIKTVKFYLALPPLDLQSCILVCGLLSISTSMSNKQIIFNLF